MNTYISESEQVELVKKWWREYGVAVIVGILIAAAIGFGWRHWQQHREHQLENASISYEQLLTNLVNDNTDAADQQASQLLDRYPHTPYAELASLQLARQDVYQNHPAEAEKRLRWIMQHGDTPALRELARLRIARILLAQNQPQQALDLLTKTDDKAYTALVQEIRGDTLAKMGKTVEARQAYQNAIKAFPNIETLHPLLQMKLDDLASAEDKEA